MKHLKFMLSLAFVCMLNSGYLFAETSTLNVSKMVTYSGAIGLLNGEKVPNGQGIMTCRAKVKTLQGTYEKTMSISGLFRPKELSQGVVNNVRIYFVEDNYLLTTKEITYNMQKEYCWLQTSDTLCFKQKDRENYHTNYKIYTTVPYNILLLGSTKFSASHGGQNKGYDNREVYGYCFISNFIKLVKGDKNRNQAPNHIIVYDNDDYVSPNNIYDWIEIETNNYPYPYQFSSEPENQEFPNCIKRMCGPLFQEPELYKVFIFNTGILGYLNLPHESYSWTAELQTLVPQNYTGSYPSSYPKGMNFIYLYKNGSFKHFTPIYNPGPAWCATTVMYKWGDNDYITTSTGNYCSCKCIDEYHITRQDGVIIRSTGSGTPLEFSNCDKVITQVHIQYPDSSEYWGSLQDNTPSYYEPIQFNYGIMTYPDGTIDSWTNGQSERTIQMEKEAEEKRLAEERQRKEQEIKDRYNTLTAKYDKKFAEAIVKNEVIIGMTEEMLFLMDYDWQQTRKTSTRYGTYQEYKGSRKGDRETYEFAEALLSAAGMFDGLVMDDARAYENSMYTYVELENGVVTKISNSTY